MCAEYLFHIKSIETHARAFLALIILGIGTVQREAKRVAKREAKREAKTEAKGGRPRKRRQRTRRGYGLRK